MFMVARADGALDVWDYLASQAAPALVLQARAASLQPLADTASEGSQGRWRSNDSCLSPANRFSLHIVGQAASSHIMSAEQVSGSRRLCSA